MKNKNDSRKRNPVFHYRAADILKSFVITRPVDWIVTVFLFGINKMARGRDRHQTTTNSTIIVRVRMPSRCSDQVGG